MGMTPCGMANPCPCSRKKRMTPSAAASPKALPPASSRPCTVSTCDSGRMSSVSRQPGGESGHGDAWREALRAKDGGAAGMVPVVRGVACQQAVDGGQGGIAHGNSCGGGWQLRPCNHTAAAGRGRMGQIFHVHAKKESFPLQGMPVRSRAGRREASRGSLRDRRWMLTGPEPAFFLGGRRCRRKHGRSCASARCHGKNRAPRERKVRRGARRFLADAADQASMSRKYWCRRRSGVSSGWKEVASTLP